jgi:hypothetical protein
MRKCLFVLCLLLTGCHRSLVPAKPPVSQSKNIWVCSKEAGCFQVPEIKDVPSGYTCRDVPSVESNVTVCVPYGES